MMKKIRIFLLLFVSVLLFSPSLTAHANDNAYVSCLYDEQTMCYRTSVIFSADETELKILKRYAWKYDNGKQGYFGVKGDKKEAYLNGDPSVLLGVDTKHSLCSYYHLNTLYYAPYIINNSDASVDGDDVDRSEKGVWQNRAATVCTFPTNYYQNATKADINRAYEVADVLGGDLTKALVFLNDEQSFTAIGNDSYLYQLRYFLLQGIATSSSQPYTATNAYGSKYQIEKNGNKVKITKLGHYTKNTANAEANKNADTKGVANAWDETSFEKDSRQVSKTFVWKMSKGYQQKADGGTTVKFYDGYRGQNNLDGGVYKALDVEEGATYTDSISWVNLIVEAELGRIMGITYQNQSDLYSFDSTDSAVLAKLVDTFNALQNSLDCYEISDLVFNSGIFASDAYYYGCIPSSWVNYINVFYVICAVIAFSIITLSLTLTLGKNTIASASAGVRFTLMQEVRDLFIACLLIAVGFGLINILFYISDLIVQIFSSVATASGRTIESLQPGHMYGNLSSTLLNFGYFGLKVYINITYIIRRFVLTALISTTPLFIIAYGFGQKGKEITMRWISELFGHIAIQPIHAITFCIIVTVSTGLRSVESVALFACILPLGNFFRSIITKGGNFAVSQGQKIGSSMISQHSALAGTEALKEQVDKYATPFSVGGSIIGAVGGIVAAGVGSGGNVGAVIAGGAAGATAGAAKGNELGTKLGMAHGQEEQTAYQTAGAMANMMASGGDDSGVSSGISGMGSARVNTEATQRAVGFEIANQFAQGLAGSVAGGAGANGLKGAAIAASSGINAVTGAKSGAYMLSMMQTQNAMLGMSMLDNFKNMENAISQKEAFTSRAGDVSTSIKHDSQGNITGGTVSLSRPADNAPATTKDNYTALSQAIAGMQDVKSGNYSKEYTDGKVGEYQSIMQNMGLSPQTAATISSGGTIKVQLDASQMTNLVQGIGNAVSKQ